MALNQFGLGFVLTAKDMASSVLSKVQGKLDDLAKDSEAMRGRLSSASKVVGVGLAGLGASALTLYKTFGMATAAGEFDAQMTRVQAISGSTAEQMAALRQGVLGLQSARFAPQELAAGLETLTVEGVKADQQVGALEASMRLAAATNSDLGMTISTLTDLTKLAGVGYDQLGTIADKLVVAQRDLEMGGRDYTAVIGRAAEMAAQYGESMDDVLIGIGMMRKAGMSAGAAAAGYGMQLQRLAGDEKTQQLLQKQGISVYDQQTGAFRGMLPIIQDIRTATVGMTETRKNQFLMDVAGGRGVRTLVAIMDAEIQVQRGATKETLRGADAIAQYQANLRGASGAAAAFVAQTEGSLVPKTKQLGIAWEKLRIAVGTPFKAAYEPIIAALAGAVTRLTQAWDGLSDTTKGAIARAVVWGAVLLGAVSTITILYGVSMMLPIAFALVKASLIAVTGGLWAAVAAAGALAVALAPYIAIGAAVAGVSYLIYKAWQGDFGGIRELVGEALGTLRDAVVPIWDALRSLGASFQDIWAKVAGVLDLAGWRAGVAGAAILDWETLLKGVGVAFGWMAKIIAGGIAVLLVPIELLADGIALVWEAISKFTSGDVAGGFRALGVAVLMGLMWPFKAVLAMFGVNIGKLRDLAGAALAEIEWAVLSALGYIAQAITKIGQFLGFEMEDMAATAEMFTGKAAAAEGRAAATEARLLPAKEAVAFGAPEERPAGGPRSASAELLGRIGGGATAPAPAAAGLGRMMESPTGADWKRQRQELQEAVQRGIEQGMARVAATGLKVTIDGRAANDALGGAAQRANDAALGAPA